MVVFGSFGFLAMVVDGCSLASCCWVVVWLWIVPLINLWVFFFFFGSGIYYFILVDILFYCDVYIILLY